MSQHAPISGGQPDSLDSNVFLLVSHRTQGVALCSASLIAPNLLLTARHCVSNVTSELVTCGKTEAAAPFAANTFFATNVPSIQEASSAFEASAVSVPSDGTDICGFDLALVTLETLVPSNVATPLVPRVDLPVIAGEAYSAVGYGQDTPGDAGTAGDRRGRSGLTVDCAPGVCSGAVEADEFVGEAGICSGDSGGPALDAAGKVVGVVSRSADNCNHPVYGSVASWKEWITGVARQAAMQGNYQPAAWAAEAVSATPATGEGGANDGAQDGSAGASASASSGGASAALPGTQGAPCTAQAQCLGKSGCYSPSGAATSKDGYCAAFCTDQAQCSNGSRCDLVVGKNAGLDTGVCITPASSAGNDSSCAVSAGGRPRGGAGWLAAAGLALALAKRRRAR